ncbi:hypothetical protein CEXT_522991 [Caerostris extrusa]|uniref:Uncharacterized protein n=1 Tax=Caerostris extrusa TaxID=172846 RepID=A0AAV4P6L8_CAEEX|nr:hypothetical protein CEXT_522991 [Caerostris extrusa]
MKSRHGALSFRVLLLRYPVRWLSFRPFNRRVEQQEMDANVSSGFYNLRDGKRRRQCKHEEKAKKRHFGSCCFTYIMYAYLFRRSIFKRIMRSTSLDVMTNASVFCGDYSHKLSGRDINR